MSDLNSVLIQDINSAVLSSPRNFTIKKVNMYNPAETDVVIQLEGCGVCASNLPLWQGRSWFNYPQKPGAPGHEGWGKVIACGKNVTTVTVGQRVAFLSFSSFSQYDVVEQSNVVVIPDKLDSIPFPGEPLGCAMNIKERSQLLPGQSVAIIGSGFLGNVLCQLMQSCGAQVTVLSKRKKNLELALQNGAEKIFHITTTADLITTLRSEKPGGYDRVIETYGYQQALDIAGEIVCPGGKIIIAGYHQDGLRSVNMQMWNWKGIDVINAHERDNSKYLKGIRLALESLLNKQIDPMKLFTHHFKLSEIYKAFQLLDSPPDGFVKALVHL